MKVFGKELFSKAPTPELYDFAQHGLLRSYGAYDEILVVANEAELEAATKAKKKVAKKPAKLLSPKDIYKLQTLNDDTLTINCDPKYINENIKALKLKQNILGPEPKRDKKNRLTDFVVAPEGGAVMYGRKELASMIERLENRDAYSQHKEFFDSYPYTTSERILDLLNKEKHLEGTRIEEMLPDMPIEAVTTMSAYIKVTKEICDKKPVFYLIKEKKRSQEVQRRRDPILLVQSPFGFVWQILGAWDKEIKFLDEL